MTKMVTNILSIPSKIKKIQEMRFILPKTDDKLANMDWCYPGQHGLVLPWSTLSCPIL